MSMLTIQEFSSHLEECNHSFFLLDSDYQQACCDNAPVDISLIVRRMFVLDNEPTIVMKSMDCTFMIHNVVGVEVASWGDSNDTILIVHRFDGNGHNKCPPVNIVAI